MIKQISKISIAPMLDWSDRHYRYFMRQITLHSILYTEMMVADAIIHGDKERLLGYDNLEHPIVLQLGGSDPAKLAAASKIAIAFNYDEINLNVGCPSDRVKSGNFGACLMEDPALVGAAVGAMQDKVSIPVTVKHRIGLNKIEDYSFVRDFVGVVSEAGCRHFIVHARNAILQGLSPKQNREIPPLKYDYVYRLKRDFPHLEFTINGGIKTCADIDQHLKHVDGVMLGREAYYNPYLFVQIENLFFNNNVDLLTMRKNIAIKMLGYLEKMCRDAVPLHHVTRHMLGLYHGCPQAKLWRTTLTQGMIKENSLKLYENLIQQMDS